MFGGAVDDLKTKGSRRRLPLLPEIVQRLQKLRMSDSDDWVFQASNGSPNPGNWLKREVRPAAVKLGVRLTGWHDFRHFFATQLRRSGAHPKVVSNLLGHSGGVLAMEVYDHVEAADLAGPARQMLCDVMKGAASC